MASIPPEQEEQYHQGINIIINSSRIPLTIKVGNKIKSDFAFDRVILNTHTISLTLTHSLAHIHTHTYEDG